MWVACIALLALASGSCVSVNQKLNKENRALFEGAPKDTNFADEGAYVQRPWVAGQWATYAIRNKKIWTLQKVSIVSADENGFWVEMETYDPNAGKSPSWMKLQISGYDPADPETIRTMSVGDMYMLQEEGAQVSNAKLPFGLANPWEGVLKSMELSLQPGPSADVTVGAGRFVGSKRIDSTIELYGYRSEGTAWFHGAVPIWGYVLQVSKDGNYESKLLEFGYEGAVSKVDHSNAVNPFGG